MQALDQLNYDFHCSQSQTNFCVNQIFDFKLTFMIFVSYNGEIEIKNMMEFHSRKNKE